MNKILLFATVAAALVVAFLMFSDEQVPVAQIQVDSVKKSDDSKKDSEITINYEKGQKKLQPNNVAKIEEKQDETLTFDNVYILSEASTETFSLFLISDSELTQPQNMFPQIPAIVKGTVNKEPFSIMIPIGVINNDMRIRITNHKTKITKEFKKIMTKLTSGSSNTINFDFNNLQSADFEIKEQDEARPALPMPF